MGTQHAFATVSLGALHRHPAPSGTRSYRPGVGQKVGGFNRRRRIPDGRRRPSMLLIVRRCNAPHTVQTVPGGPTWPPPSSRSRTRVGNLLANWMAAVYRRCVSHTSQSGPRTLTPAGYGASEHGSASWRTRRTSSENGEWTIAGSALAGANARALPRTLRYRAKCVSAPACMNIGGFEGRTAAHHERSSPSRIRTPSAAPSLQPAVKRQAG